MNIKKFKLNLSHFSKGKKPLSYGLTGFLMAIALSVGVPQVAYSWSLFDLLIPAIQVFQLSNLSDAQEIDLGKQINQEISQEVTISRNRQLTNYVNEIGQKLAQNSNRSNIPYVFQVVENDEINAFATMGGYVYIQTGLLKAAKNEAELASVIAHEIGHIVAKHSVKQMRQQALTQGLLTAAGLDQSAAVQIGVQLALSLPHSRADELEADQLGLDNITRACYNPSGMVNFMRTLEQASGGSNVPTFISTHPSPQNRVSLLQQRINTNNQTPEITSYVSDHCAGQNNGLDQQVYRNRLQSVGLNF